VGAYKLDEGTFVFVGKMDNKAIFIAAYIEDGSVISDEVHVCSKRRLQV